MRWFERDLTTLAFCWRLTRRDGVRLGFTSHDADLLIDGLLYRATPGMSPSAIETSDGVDASGVDLAGALSSSAIDAADLRAGRWDGTQVRLSAHDWTSPGSDPLFLLRGELGPVSFQDDRFSVELIGPAAVLERPVAPETSPLCRAILGDKACRVDMAARTSIHAVVSANGPSLSFLSSFPAGLFAHGRIRWLNGANAGLDGWIDGSDGTALHLRAIPNFPVQIGDLCVITQGCDRRFETCRDRFGNSLNFRGEPHLPGNDMLTRYAS